MRTIEVIDLSQHNDLPSRSSDDVDWDRVRRAGVEGAFFRAMYVGTSGRWAGDPQFRYFYEGAARAGVMHLGSYFYWRAIAQASPKDLAKRYADYHGSLPIAPAVDVEDPGDLQPGVRERVADKLFEFLEELEVESGRIPLIYTMPNFWDPLPRTWEPRFARHPLWLAQWDGKPKALNPWRVVGGEDNWFCHQYDGGEGRCPGVTGACDRNRLRVDDD